MVGLPFGGATGNALVKIFPALRKRSGDLVGGTSGLCQLLQFNMLRVVLHKPTRVYLCKRSETNAGFSEIGRARDWRPIPGERTPACKPGIAPFVCQRTTASSHVPNNTPQHPTCTQRGGVCPALCSCIKCPQALSPSATLPQRRPRSRPEMNCKPSPCNTTPPL